MDAGRQKAYLGDDLHASRNFMIKNHISDGLSLKSDSDDFMGLEFGDEIMNQESPKLPPPTPISLKV